MKKILFIILIGISLFSCKKEFTDHNKITEDAAYHTPDAYPGILLGMTKSFATGTLYRIVHGPGLTAREFANMLTYETETQLSEGGPALTGANSSVSSMWYGLHRNRGVAEKVLFYIDDVDFVDADKKAAYKAYAKFMKAITTGYMAQYWEKVTLENDPDNQAEFVDRTTGLQQAISDLDSAMADLDANPGAEAVINSLVSFEFSIRDAINAFKARYEIELGNYQEAFDAADAVDLTKRSVWSYDGGSIKNPIYAHILDPGATLRIRPIDSLGLIGTQTPELGDLRNDFYLNYTTDVSTVGCGDHVDDPEGFWDADNKPIPVYLPGEMLLIKAEAKARMNQLTDAVGYIDQVRTKTIGSDVFGVGASLAGWTGDATNQQEVLDEIYKNYAIELFMEGQRWPIHRRFYPNYLDNVDFNTVNVCTLERVNNFYPYPDKERANNPNCPPDPAY